MVNASNFMGKQSRGSCFHVLFRTIVLKNLENFTGKHLRWSPSFSKVAGLRISYNFQVEMVSFTNNEFKGR